MSRKLVAAIMMGQKKAPLSDPHDSNASSSLSGGGGGSLNLIIRHPAGRWHAQLFMFNLRLPQSALTSKTNGGFFCGPCAMYGSFMSIWMG